jgi:hypothetical protein
MRCMVTGMIDPSDRTTNPAQLRDIHGAGPLCNHRKRPAPFSVSLPMTPLFCMADSPILV